MPYQDRTGPFGRGPMTGRGLGFCRRKPINLSRNEEKEILKAQLKEIEERLKEIK